MHVIKKLDEIIVKDRIRQDMGKGNESVIELANSLEANGQIHDIVLNGNELKAGGRRYSATLFLSTCQPPRRIGGLLDALVPRWHLYGDVRYVPVGEDPHELVPNPRILDVGCIRATQWFELSRKDQIQIEIEENVRRKDFNKAEESLGIERLRSLIAEQDGISVDEVSTKRVAGVAQVSVAQVSMGLQVAKAVRGGATELLNSKSIRGAYDKLKGMENLAARVAAVRAATPREDLVRHVYKGDGVEWLKTLDKDFVDLWIFDPPWGIDIDTYTRDVSDTHWKDDYETAVTLFRQMLPELYRVLKNDSWMPTFFGEQFQDVTRRGLEHAACCQGKDKKPHTVKGFRVPPVPHIWYKPNKKGAQNDPSLVDINQYEPFFVCSKGQPRIYKQAQGNVLVHDMPARSERFHTAQKSLSLAKDMIERWSFGNMRVGDPTAGSFVFLKGARQLGRSYCGAELDEQNYEQGVIYLHEEEKK